VQELFVLLAHAATDNEEIGAEERLQSTQVLV
jgi:hypothetical protein